MKQNNDQQLVSELMKPRYKCIASYPFSPVRIDQIMTGETFNLSGQEKVHMVDYPAIFQRLDWWEDRKESEMPEYIRMTDENMVIKVDCFVWGIGFNFYYGNSAGYGKRAFNEYTIPATLSEYNQYLSQIKSKD